MLIKFIATDNMREYPAQDYKFWNRKVIDVYPQRANELLKTYPQNFVRIFTPPEKITPGIYKKEKYSLGFFLDNNIPTHISGGRYHGWLTANILADIFNVTLISNNDYSMYKSIISNPNLKLTKDETFGLGWKENPFDMVLGFPKLGGTQAYYYAKKWKIPLYLHILETPNYTKLYRQGRDTTEEYWKIYKKCLKEADYVIPSTFLTGKYCQEWLGKEAKIFPIYPPLNHKVLNQTKDFKEEHAIVWISRFCSFKRPFDPLEIASRLDKNLVINYIVSDSPTLHQIINKAKTLGLKIRIYKNVSDKQKFEIIKRSKFLVHSSLFEGFGLPPGEALLCRRPCVAYDMPIFREIYKDKLEYAKYGDVNSLVARAKKLLQDENYRKGRGEEGYQFIKEQTSFEKLTQDFLKIMPKMRISFFMIVFEGEDYLEANLKQIYPHAYQILIAEGAVNLMAKVKGYFRSKDKTLEIIKNFPDPENKIKLIQVNRPWKDKCEMKNEILKYLNGEILFQVDVDEFYHHEDIDKIRRSFQLNKTLDLVTFTAYHFWYDLHHFRIDTARWNIKNLRVFRNKGKIHFRFHGFPDRDGKPYNQKNFKALDLGRIRFHYGYVRGKENIKDKIEFMKLRDGDRDYSKNLAEFLTHKVKLEEFKGEHPEIIEKIRIRNVC